MVINAKAFLFDLNGTVIVNMPYHVIAWHDILNNDLNAGLTIEQVKVQMYGKNEEVLGRLFGKGHFSQERMNDLSFEKERRYQQAYLPKLALIDGLKEFLDQAKAAGIKMAIGSAAIPFNIDFVLDNLQLRDYFTTVVSADDVSISKPHPDTFLKCAAALGVDAKDCLVFEDAPKGVESALNAGMQTFVLTSTHPKEDFLQYGNVIGYSKDYSDLMIGKAR
jgi:HAD superfamily hydrolase (TIGR01509 family)